MNQYIVIWHELIVLVNHDYSLDYVHREWNWIKQFNGDLGFRKFCQYKNSVRRMCNDYAAFIKNLVFYMIHNQPNFMVDFTAFGEKVCTCLFFLSRWQSDKSALRIDKKLRIEIWHFLSRLILKDTSCHLGLVVLQPK